MITKKQSIEAKVHYLKKKKKNYINKNFYLEEYIFRKNLKFFLLFINRVSKKINFNNDYIMNYIQHVQCANRILFSKTYLTLC